VITLEDWALIRRLAAEGVPKARIAQRLGISRTTVIKAVNSDASPRSLTAREELAKDGITVSIIKPGIVDTDFGQNTPSPEPAALRRDPDGNLLPHVIAPTTVAAAVADIIGSGDPELDLLET